MINLMRSLYAYGKRRGIQDRSRLDAEKYRCVEITSLKPDFIIPTEPIDVPLGVDRSSNDKPNHLYDNVKYVLDLGKEGFIEQLEEEFKEVTQDHQPLHPLLF